MGIVSGRSLRDVRARVRVPGAAYAGCHGLEIAWRGVRFRHPRAVRLVRRLRRAERELRRTAAYVPGTLLEWKGLMVSLHYRLAPPAALPALRAAVRRVAAEGPTLEVLAGQKVLELRPDVAWGKGEAAGLLRRILGRSLGQGVPVTLYLGDDQTDAEAFRALRGRALCVAVGRQPARANYRLPGPAAVRGLLAWLVTAIG